MKLKYKYPLYLLVILIVSVTLSSCDEEEAGEPFISYVRVTEPAASDSLLDAAWQGQMIAIIGGNLKNTREVWFNDRQALVLSTLITDNSVLVRVPNSVPSDITNKLKLVFANGNSIDHDFGVVINRPQPVRMKSEYVNEGDVAVIYGSYFYEPITVTFNGGVAGEVISVKDEEIQVKVPAGAQSGPIRVQSNFGVSESRFWFKDMRNIIVSFDISLVNWVWKGPDFIVTSDPAVSNINGKFARVNRGLQPAYPFLEMYGGSKEQGSDICIETRNIPIDAFENPGDYNLKFEINTQQSFVGGTMRIYMGNANNANLGGQRELRYYAWNSNVDSKGAWQTVTIPWTSVYEANGQFPYASDGYAMFLYFHGPNSAIHNFAMDNMRVVPN